MNLYEKTLYTSPMKYIKSNIFEYDITKANISILYSKGLIDLRQYTYLASQCTRLERQVMIGMMQKNPVINKAIRDGFLEARKALFEANNIQDEEVVAIKKDAVYTTRKLQHLKFNNIVFKERYVADLFCQVGGLEIYFRCGDGTVNIEVKGINNDKLEQYHYLYMAKICDVLYLLMNNQRKMAIREWVKFMRLYDSKKLDIEYYRELNSESMYQFNNNYGLTFLPKDASIDSLDIRYNHLFNKEFYGLIVDMVI